MEINKLYGDLGSYSSQQLEETQRAAADQSATQTTQSEAGGDHVALSTQARLLATALGTASSSSDVRSDKVRDLKSQVEAGTYKPDLKKAAANLLRDEGDLFSVNG